MGLWEDAENVAEADRQRKDAHTRQQDEALQRAVAKAETDLRDFVDSMRRLGISPLEHCAHPVAGVRRQSVTGWDINPYKSAKYWIVGLDARLYHLGAQPKRSMFLRRDNVYVDFSATRDGRNLTAAVQLSFDWDAQCSVGEFELDCTQPYSHGDTSEYLLSELLRSALAAAMNKR